MPEITEQGDDIVRVRLSTMIGLNRDARSIPLISSRVKAQLSGGYLSTFRGRGMEFLESRPYQPGDDIRSIDWRVTARSGRTHTKIYHEERERPVLLWVDLTHSMFFGTRTCYKSVLAAKLASLFAWSSIQQGDRLGGFVFSEQNHVEFRPMRGRRACLHLIQKLASHSAWEQQQTQSDSRDSALQALNRLRHVSKPGSLIILFSDFRFLSDDCRFHLTQLARHNDVMMVFTHDPLEQMLPPAGRYRLTDGLTETEIDSSDPDSRQIYQQRFVDHREQLRQISIQHRLHLIEISTSDNMLQSVQSGLGIRKSA
jgi:uncharacterized protein (DUF58 family)